MEMYEEIFEKARAMSQSELSGKAEEALREMCLAAFYELAGRLRTEISVEDIRGQFVRAAATLGLSLFVGLESDSVGGFSAGRVRVQRRAGSEARASAASLRKQAELMLAGYLKDGGFAFRAVRA